MTDLIRFLQRSETIRSNLLVSGYPSSIFICEIITYDIFFLQRRKKLRCKSKTTEKSEGKMLFHFLFESQTFIY